MVEAIQIRILVKTQVDKALKDLGKTTKKTTGLTKSVGKLRAGYLLLGAVIGGVLVKSINAFIKKAADFEQLNVSFKTFLGSAEKATKVLKKLENFSIVTPFTIDQINKAGKGLLAFGIESKDLIPTLKTIGDVASATGKDFNELAIIYGKAKTQGTLFGEDINQLTEAGIPIIKEFAKQLGVTEGEVKKLASQGKISFTNLQTAFESMTGEGGQFFDLMSKQSKTFGGRLSTLQGNLSLVSRAIGNKLLPLAGFFVDKLNGIITAQEKQSVVTERVNTTLQTNIGMLKDANLSEGARKIVLGKVNKVLKELNLKQLSAKSSLEEMNTASEKANALFLKRIKLAVVEEELAKNTKKGIDLGREIFNLNKKEIRLNLDLIKAKKALAKTNKQTSTQELIQIEGNVNGLIAAIGLGKHKIEQAKKGIKALQEENVKIQEQADALLGAAKAVDVLNDAKTKGADGKDAPPIIKPPDPNETTTVLDQNKKTWQDYFSAIMGMARQAAQAIGSLLSMETNNNLTRLQKETIAFDEKNATELASLKKRFADGIITEAEFNQEKEGLDAKSLEAKKGFAKRESELKKKAFEQDKKEKIVSILMSGAEAIANIWAKWASVPPVAIGLTAGAAGIMGAQLAVVSGTEAPAFAQGTSSAPGGMALVGENGPEVVNIPIGSQVIPNHLLGGSLGNNTTNNNSSSSNVTNNYTVHANDPIELVNEVMRINGREAFI